MVIPSHKDRKSLWLTMFDCRGNRNSQDSHASTFRKSPFLQGLLSCLNGLFPLEKEFKRHGIGCPLEQVFLDFQGIIDKCIHQRRVIQGIQILQYGHVKLILTRGLIGGGIPLKTAVEPSAEHDSPEKEHGQCDIADQCIHLPLLTSSHQMK